jgi:membrane-bound metal-dependent hydrolase YbcI (DUF457 family)
MKGPMPSPIGHALAGLAVAWIAEPSPTDRSPVSPASTDTRASDNATAGPVAGLGVPPSWHLPLICLTLAVLPDVDLVYQPVHRTATHSVGAAILVIIIAAAVTRWVNGRINWHMALLCGAAYGTHILLDWLGVDQNEPAGVQALWPFNGRFFISPWTIFPGTERDDPLSTLALIRNAKAAATELAVMGPIVWMARRWRRVKAVNASQA